MDRMLELESNVGTKDDAARDRMKDALSNVFGVCSCVAEDGLGQAQ